MEHLTPSPPEHLREAGQTLWRAILAQFAIEDSHHLELLGRAAEQADRAESCRQRIQQDGVAIVDGKGQVKPHPLLAHERAAANLERLLLRELGLDLSAPSSVNESTRMNRGSRY